MVVSDLTCLPESIALRREPVSQVTQTKDRVKSGKQQGAKFQHRLNIGIVPEGKQGNHTTDTESDTEWEISPLYSPWNYRETRQYRNLEASLHRVGSLINLVNTVYIRGLQLVHWDPGVGQHWTQVGCSSDPGPLGFDYSVWSTAKTKPPRPKSLVWLTSWRTSSPTYLPITNQWSTLG